MEATRQRGDVMQVVRMTAAARIGPEGNGYSFHYVRQVLNGVRKNADITSMYNQLVALRTPVKRRRK
ncbi:MAG TPA: hypothetical protein PL070_08720 [Flavobacteriales bacterium]|nr:hypothetical protein [Flavobacteriales bacterium]